MSKGKLIKVCGECANYDWKKHRCKLGCNEGEPQEPFYSDCPLPTVDTDQVCKPTEWISVEERLPERGESVLVYSSKYYPIVECRDLVTYMRMGNYSGVTHWMPLPEPPKMGGAE